MLKRDAFIAFAIAVNLMIVGAWYTQRSPKFVPVQVNFPETSALPADVAVGKNLNYLGLSTSVFTLVEFADYQCPPCAKADAKIHKVLDAHSGKIKFTFRNFPLTNIHPQAMAAALTAETARAQGKFWPVHDALFQLN